MEPNERETPLKQTFSVQLFITTKAPPNCLQSLVFFMFQWWQQSRDPEPECHVAQVKEHKCDSQMSIYGSV
jgi:hypothetical protein